MSRKAVSGEHFAIFAHVDDCSFLRNHLTVYSKPNVVFWVLLIGVQQLGNVFSHCQSPRKGWGRWWGVIRGVVGAVVGVGVQSNPNPIHPNPNPTPNPIHPIRYTTQTK